MVVVVLFEFSYVLAHVHHSSRETVVSFEVPNVLCLSILVGVQCCSSVRCCLFVELCVFSISHRHTVVTAVPVYRCYTVARMHKQNPIWFYPHCASVSVASSILYTRRWFCVYTHSEFVRFGSFWCSLTLSAQEWSRQAAAHLLCCCCCCCVNDTQSQRDSAAELREKPMYNITNGLKLDGEKKLKKSNVEETRGERDRAMRVYVGKKYTRCVLYNSSKSQ